MSKNFAMTGVAGYIAPRHLKAIKETQNNLLAAVDPHDSVGLLDSHFPDAKFFTEFERFDRHIDKLRRQGEEKRVHYVTICSPNYLHDAHVRFALRIGADAICEKPLVINPWNLDALQELEAETGRKVNTVLQLRLHPDLIALKQRVDAEGASTRHRVCLTYVTTRGRWYDVSWKGSEERSGGIVTNIGIHFFDLLMWLFGPVEQSTVHLHDARRVAGALELAKARVVWFLSADPRDLPFPPQPGVRTTFRSITVDGIDVEFSDGFTDLHTRVYEEVLAGRGFGIDVVRPSIELSASIRHAPVTTATVDRHPNLAQV